MLHHCDKIGFLYAMLSIPTNLYAILTVESLSVVQIIEK